MEEQNQKGRLIAALCLLLSVVFSLSAQEQSEQRDSLLRLMSASYIEQLELGDDYVRRTLDATFLHNGTYLICDSALWSQNTNIINCMGHVRMIQGDTELTSEKLDYLIDEDLAQFRGPVVQLHDKQDNTLRTRILDYNTRDSVAVFRSGASMRSSDGQIIESDEGSYFNAQSLFKFVGNVNMYTDSVFVRTDSLDYLSDLNRAEFIAPIDFRKDDNLLSAGGGWYRRADNLFFFTDNVRALTRDQESWSDTLYFYRASNDVLMRGRVQVQDTTRSSAAVSDYLFYRDTLSQVTLHDNAAVALWSESEDKIDTTYFGADTLVYHTERRCDIAGAEISAAEARLTAINGDPVTEFRRRAAAQAAKGNDSSSQNKGNGRGGMMVGAGRGGRQGLDAPGTAPASDSAAGDAASTAGSEDSAPTDSTLAPGGLPARDSLAVQADSLSTADSLALVPPPDTSRVGFLRGIGNVKIFRQDIQVRCDSMLFSELDSIARFYKDPLVWNEGRRQYSADSLFVLVKSNGPDRASLMSNAFIAVQEDSLLFDQIKGSEVMAYFDSDTQLRRFDALGGVTAIFYLQEDDVFATVNRVEAKMLSATLKNGDVDRVYYFENPKNDAYPIVQMPERDRTLKGLQWRPERRPSGRTDITTLELRPSEREALESRPRAEFKYTDIYFPGYMEDVHRILAEAKLRRETPAADSLSSPMDAPVLLDSLSVPGADSLALRDSLGLAVKDSLAVGDSLAVSDSLGVAAPEEEQYMSKAELRRAMRRARRDARWAELDARDAARAAAKEQKKEERRRRREERRAARAAKQEAKDNALLQKYIEYYQKQKERDERKQESESARERTSGTEAGGSVSAPPESEREAA